MFFHVFVNPKHLTHFEGAQRLLEDGQLLHPSLSTILSPLYALLTIQSFHCLEIYRLDI